MLSIVRREYLRQRRARNQGYARQIREEERLQNEARERAIRLFERFIRRYPDDPTYTPDAMFRLGELYFERSAIEFQTAYEDAQAARDRGETPPEGGDTPDFTPTIELYRAWSAASRTTGGSTASTTSSATASTRWAASTRRASPG